MTQMFYNCFNLETLDLSSFNTANVRDMAYMFSTCRHLVTIWANWIFYSKNRLIFRQNNM